MINITEVFWFWLECHCYRFRNGIAIKNEFDA